MPNVEQITYEQYVTERKRLENALDSLIAQAENDDFQARLRSERSEDWSNNVIDGLELWGER